MNTLKFLAELLPLWKQDMDYSGGGIPRFRRTHLITGKIQIRYTSGWAAKEEKV